MPKRAPRAVLLDFDGVIADTENLHVASWERTLAAIGFEVTTEQCIRAAEVDDRAFLTELLAARGIEGGDVDGWVGRKQALAEALLSECPRLYPGVAELVHALQGLARLAVVSSARRAEIAIVLEAGGIADAFEAIVGKEDVSAFKPDPEPYRIALDRLGLRPEQALAIEDSPTGLDAVRAAGVRCLVVGHRRPRGDWIGDADYLDDLTETPAVLRAIGIGDG